MSFSKHLYKTAFVFSISLPLGLIATAALAQEALAQEAAISEVSVPEMAEQEAVEVEAVDPQAIAPKDIIIPDFFPAQRLEEFAEAAELRAVSEPIKRPGAEALDSLETVGLADGLELEAAEIDLAAISEKMRREPGVEAGSVSALTAALSSDNVLTRLYAADTLWTMTGDRDLVLPTLIQAAASEEDQVRELAISALTQLGEQALPAVPVLNGLLTNQNSKTRSLARDAITVIRSSNPTTAISGIVIRRARRRLLPAAVRAITDLWR